MRSLTTTTLCLGLTALACGSASDTAEDNSTGGDWRIHDLTLEDGSLHYVEVNGQVTLKSNLGGSGTTAETRFYSDAFETLIAKDTHQIGSDLDDAGTTQAFSISHYKVWLLPATSGYDRVCVEFRADDSNHDEWGELGCIEASD